MSNYYLCDTCAVNHWFNVESRWWECDEGYVGKIPIYDGQTPHEVCKHWKPKEVE